MNGRKKGVRTIGLVLGTALAVTAAPALARTVVDYARNAAHVDGLRAVRAITKVGDRAGKLVATNAHGYLPNGIIHRARDAAHLGGFSPSTYQHACAEGTVAGFAQVPGDVPAAWTEVTGYGRSEFSIGAVRRGGPSSCRAETALAKQLSPGVYEVSLNSSLAWACTMADVPRNGDTLPAVVSVVSPNGLIATYTTQCDSNDKGFVEQVRISTATGAPTSAEFTIATLEPVVVAEP